MHSETEKKWISLHSKVQKYNLIKIFKSFRRAGIEPILIKGYAIERLYDENRQRISFDIDIAVSIDNYDCAKELVKSEELESINIDLHKELRHLDNKDWNSLLADSLSINIESSKITTLCEEDHLRVLCTHWLTDGGENKDKLWDIYYAVENRSNDFSWEKCFNQLDENRLFWVKYTIGIAYKYLNLDISSLPFIDDSKTLPNWLLKSLDVVWSREFPFIPLDACYNDKQMFLYQLKLRFPPNPIMATIGVDGDLRVKSPSKYQLMYFIQQSKSSLNSYVKYLLKK